MPLGSAEIEQIGTYVRANLAEWMEDIVGPQLVGRTARVEDELAFQRELICTRFEAVDKRFEDLHRSMDKHFEAVDKRFEDLHRNMDKRFEAVDKRFEDMHKRFNGMQWMVGGGVVLLATMMSLFRFFG